MPAAIQTRTATPCAITIEFWRPTREMLDRGRAVGIGQLFALSSPVGDRSAENVASTGWLISSPRRPPRSACGGQFLRGVSGNSPTAWLGRRRDERGLRGSSPLRNDAPCGGSGCDYPQEWPRFGNCLPRPLHGPLGGRAANDVDVRNLPAPMLDDEESAQQPGRHHRQRGGRKRRCPGAARAPSALAETHLR